LSRLSQLSTRPDSVTLTTWAEDAPGRGEGWRQDAKLRRSGQTKATTGPAIDESRCRRNGYRKRETSGVCTGAGWEWAGNRDFGTTPELIHMAECLRARRVRSAAIVSEYDRSEPFFRRGAVRLSCHLGAAYTVRARQESGGKAEALAHERFELDGCETRASYLSIGTSSGTTVFLTPPTTIDPISGFIRRR